MKHIYNLKRDKKDIRDHMYVAAPHAAPLPPVYDPRHLDGPIEDQLNTLTTVVANPNYVPLAMQVQINMLIGYLNNSNATIANTARAVIINNIAPGLPTALLQTINAQIAAKVGS